MVESPIPSTHQARIERRDKGIEFPCTLAPGLQLEHGQTLAEGTAEHGPLRDPRAQILDGRKGHQGHRRLVGLPAGMMGMVAKGLSDKEIEAVADYVSGL